MAIGTSEIRIITITEYSKFSFTKGILPNKYPPSRNMLTQRMPPKTLKNKNLP